MTTILLVIAILVFLIVIHELGHFVAAKWFGVKVEEFGVGYPPRAFLFGKIGETEYSFNWIPFGGFVRLFGENGLQDGKVVKGEGSFSAAPRYGQAVILIAGVTMNAVAAWALFAGSLAIGIPHAVFPEDATSAAELIVTTVLPGSPADSVGMVAGDVIVAVSDGRTGEAAELTPDTVVEFVGERGGKEIDLTVRRGEESLEVTLFPAQAVIEQEADRAALGVGLVLVESTPLPLGDALAASVPLTFEKFGVVVAGLGTLFSGLFTGDASLREVVGPVGLVGVVGEAAQHGLGRLLILAGFISVNLAVINLLPIPALDGGRLLLLGIESFFRRSAPAVVVNALNSLGILIVVFLMIAVTYNDIVRLVT